MLTRCCSASWSATSWTPSGSTPSSARSSRAAARGGAGRACGSSARWSTCSGAAAIRAAAILLEELWNELARLHSFTLLCAYSMGNFYMPGDGELFDKVCSRHSHVIPGNEGTALRSLEHEVEQRKELEAALRETLRKRSAAAGVMLDRNAQDAERFRLLVESVKDYAIF